MKTLVLIDVQNDFLPGGALEVPGSDAIVPILNRLQPAFDLVVAAQDWHPAGHGSFASSHPGRQPFERDLRNRWRRRRRAHRACPDRR